MLVLCTILYRHTSPSNFTCCVTVAYGGTIGSRRAFSLGHGVSPVTNPTRVSLPIGVSKLNLPFANIIKCHDKMVSLHSDAVNSTQELKKQLLSSHESVRKQFISSQGSPCPSRQTGQRMAPSGSFTCTTRRCRCGACRQLPQVDARWLPHAWLYLQTRSAL